MLRRSPAMALHKNDNLLRSRNMPESGLKGLDPDLVRATLLEAADAAAAKTLAGFRTPLAVENKWESGFDPVTAADRDAEIAIRAVLSARFPEHVISGGPVWGTLIGLMHKGDAVAGLMAQPFTDELFLGIDGTSIYRHAGNTQQIRTSGVTELKQAKVTATSPDIFELSGTTANIARLRKATLQTRWGLDCYGYCLLAAGHIDIVAESALKNVDIAPLIPIIENAGGVVTTWDGGPAEQGGNCIAAATPELHEAAMKVLRG